jgi:hypothetical protein
VFTARYELNLYIKLMQILVLKGQRYVTQDSFDASRSVYKINKRSNIQPNTTVYYSITIRGYVATLL